MYTYVKFNSNSNESAESRTHFYNTPNLSRKCVFTPHTLAENKNIGIATKIEAR